MFLGNALEEHRPHLVGPVVKNGEKRWNIVEQRILQRNITA